MDWKRNMEAVSFDCLDTYYLEDYEGDIRLGSELYVKTTKLAPGVWQVLTDGDYIYVLEGEDEAVCIDSGCGAGDVRAICQELTDKPIYRLINTHNHFDHTAGNYLFDVVYMSERAYPAVPGPIAALCPESGLDLHIPADYPVSFLRQGDIFDLKGRPLEVFAGENHAIGSLQFLDRKSRILFVGDEVHGNFLECNTSVQHVYDILTMFEEYRPYYDRIAAGCGVWDAVYIDKYYEIIKYILDGHADEGEKDYEPFADVTSSITELNGKPVYHRRCPHPYGPMPGFRPEGPNEPNGGFIGGNLRRNSPDGAFDRRMLLDGYLVTYFCNRLWD